MGKAIRGALEYNEEKVSHGQARLLFAHNYLKPAGELSFHEKLGMMEKLATLNTQETKCLHISLNFHPSEKLTPEKLERIAKEYMEGLGFKDQPYMCYEHLDAAHPHIHIVTTPIQRDRSSINLKMIGKRVSEPVRKKLEEKYDLVRASGRDIADVHRIPAINIEKVIYGKKETRRAISNVVSQVLSSYKFTSLTEFNEILKQYNVMVDTGPENSRQSQHGGLIYRLMGGDGRPVGKGIKASILYKKPTLKHLQDLFPDKKRDRKKYLDKTRGLIDRVLSNPKTTTRKSFVDGLSKVGIKAIFRDNDQGRTYGLTFIDNVSRLSVKASDLGDNYSSNAIIKYLVEKGGTTLNANNQVKDISAVATGSNSSAAGIKSRAYADPVQENKQEAGQLGEALHDILKYQPPEYQLDPYKKKKRKKKKGLHL